MTLTPRLALLLTVPPLMWAGNAVVGRMFVGHVPPATLNALRWACAGLILLPLAWRVLATPRAWLQRWRHLLLLGALGVGSFNTLLYLGLRTSSAINVTLIVASLPVWMLAIGALHHGERPRRWQILGAGLSLAGVLGVITRGDPGSISRVHFVVGDLYVLVAVVAWAFYSWMLARPPASMRAPLAPQVREGGHTRGWNWAEALMVQILFGGLVAGSSSALELGLGPPAAVDWNAWTVAGIVFIAVGPSVLAYRCWGVAVAEAGPALAAFFGNLTPLFAALLSAAALGEPPQAYHAAAFLLIAAGIAVSRRA